VPLDIRDEVERGVSKELGKSGTSFQLIWFLTESESLISRKLAIVFNISWIINVAHLVAET